jgi:hypothetical protein
MKKISDRLSISPDRVSPVPKADTDRLRQAVRERVIKPMQERAREQRDLIAKVRARPVR